MKSYLMGFAVSIILTFVAYYVVTERPFSSDLSMILVALCAFVQITAQFVCFMRLGEERIGESGVPVSFDSPGRWNLIFFLFTVLIALVVVIGSIWIMYNLDYRM